MSPPDPWRRSLKTLRSATDVLHTLLENKVSFEAQNAHNHAIVCKVRDKGHRGRNLEASRGDVTKARRLC